MARIHGHEDGRFGGARSRASCLAAFLPFCLAAICLSACTRTHAKTAPDAPLDVPAPPPRDVEPNETEPPPVVPLAQEPARNTPARPRPAPATPREQPHPEPSRPEPSRPEPPPAEAPKPPPAAEEAPKPTTTLQTTPPTAEGELERSVRAAITKATSDLNRVDYRALNNDARTQYDTAKRFIRQADDAIRAKNLVFAKTVADKAVAIAAQLAGR
jgi:hypothetical protein